MAAIWPTQLPLKIRYGTEFEFGARSKTVTEFEKGPTVNRNRFTNIPFRTNITLKFTDEQYQIFLGFYTSELHNGARKFYAPVLVGIKIQSMLCQIVDQSIKPIPEDYNRWTCTISLDVYGKYALSGALIYFLGLYDEPFLIDFEDSLQEIVNEDYPEAVEGYT